MVVTIFKLVLPRIKVKLSCFFSLVETLIDTFWGKFQTFSHILNELNLVKKSLTDIWQPQSFGHCGRKNPKLGYFSESIKTETLKTMRKKQETYFLRASPFTNLWCLNFSVRARNSGLKCVCVCVCMCVCERERERMREKDEHVSKVEARTANQPVSCAADSRKTSSVQRVLALIARLSKCVHSTVRGIHA